MTSESVAEKFPRVNEAIIQSSIVFISIFATVGLLFGGITRQFKMAYFYFGYMLYYSVPFIIAAFLSTLSMLSSRENSKQTNKISFLSVCFFLTGFVMLVLLASLATQTTMLPSYFTFFPAYPSLLVLEGISALIFFLGPEIAQWFRARTSKRRGWLLPIYVFVFVFSLFVMTMYGTNQTSYVAASGSVPLAYHANKLESVNVTLLTADQIDVEMKSVEGEYFSYAFLNEKNYVLYNNTATQGTAQVIKYDFGTELAFQAAVESDGTYYLTMKSEYFLGTNVTYAIRVYRTTTNILLVSFLSSVISGAAFLGEVVLKTGSDNSPFNEESREASNPTERPTVTSHELGNTGPVSEARPVVKEDNEENYPPYQLSLTVTTPKVVTEGEGFKIGYKVKNIGKTVFPGGHVTAEISWASLDQKVYQPIVINNPLPPESEIEENRYGQAPLMAGYTWFNVSEAVASDGNAVEVYNAGHARVWPYQQIGPGSFIKQPVFAVRARTKEEIFTQRALWVAAGSLALVAAFQVGDWLLKYLFKMA